MRAFAIVICSALALTGCTTVVVESVPSETKALSPIELQNQTNQFECNELNLIFDEFYNLTLWSDDPVSAAAFAKPFRSRKNKTASDIAGWMGLAILSYEEFQAYLDSGNAEDMYFQEASLLQYQDLQATCSSAGVPLLGVPSWDSAIANARL
ncbi:hypothetical protein N8885_02610 [Aquiluna sp.]|nr:hypothetical protein [Aquiluna sp.]